MRYKVALQGFADLERRELVGWLDASRTRDHAYEHVESVPMADLLIADGDVAGVIDDVARHGRIDTTAFVGLLAPAGGFAPLQRPIDAARVLRSLDNLVARTRIEPGAFARASEIAGMPGDEPFVPTAAQPDARAIAKAAARQAARRARLVGTTASSRPLTGPPNVLVLDGNDLLRDHLCRLLEGFGFCTYPVTSIAQAAWMMQTRTFSAAFLDIGFDGDDVADSVALCRLFKGKLAPADPCGLMIVSSRIGPVDRVRAELAGVDAVLAKPLGRGDVARALELCRVALPVDERRR